MKDSPRSIRHRHFIQVRSRLQATYPWLNVYSRSAPRQELRCRFWMLSWVEAASFQTDGETVTVGMPLEQIKKEIEKCGNQTLWV